MWYCTAGTASQNSPGLMHRTRFRSPKFRASARAGLKLGNPATPFAEIPDRRQAIYYALAHAQPGDIVAILGKGHETTIERNGVKEPFVEREVVEEFFSLPSPKEEGGPAGPDEGRLFGGRP